MNKISMEELVNIVLTHSSKMTSMNKPASTPPRLLIIDRLALTSTKKDEPGLSICTHWLNSLLTSLDTAKNNNEKSLVKAVQGNEKGL